MTYGSPPRAKVRFEAIGEAWNLFTQEMGTWILAQLVLLGLIVAGYVLLLLLLFLLGAVSGANGGTVSTGAVVAFVVCLVVITIGGIAVVAPVFAGMFHMAVKQVRGESIAIGDLFAPFRQWPAVVGAALIMGIAVSVGSMLLYIPGMILAGLWMLTFPLIVDRKYGPIEAMRQSFEAVKSDWIVAAAFVFVLSLLASCGALLLGVGALFTYPLYFLGHAVVYRDAYLATMPQVPLTFDIGRDNRL